MGSFWGDIETHSEREGWDIVILPINYIFPLNFSLSHYVIDGLDFVIFYGPSKNKTLGIFRPFHRF